MSYAIIPKRRKKANQIILKLLLDKSYIGHKENMGQKELGEYKDLLDKDVTVGIIDYATRCALVNELSLRIDLI